MTLHRIGRTLRGHKCNLPPVARSSPDAPRLVDGDLFQCDECAKWYEFAGEWYKVWGFVARHRVRKARDTIIT